MQIAVTQLVLKDLRLQTLWNFYNYTKDSRIQAEASQGYLSHGYNVVGGLYTRSAWATREDMLAFKNSGAHKSAMEGAAEVAKGGRTVVFKLQRCHNGRKPKPA